MSEADCRFSAPKGVADLLPPRSALSRAATDYFGQLAPLWGYWPIETPLFEKTEVFERSVGGTSEIVTKQMYTFEDKSGDSITLRPEGTAGVVRAFIEHEIYKKEPLPWRVFYAGEMFRYERPQAGRYRQFKQVGVEAIGAEEPEADVEQIELCLTFLEGIGVVSPRLLLNSIGDKACRPRYLEALDGFLSSNDVSSKLCQECRLRIGRNPLRVLDCKRAECRRVTEFAPKSVEYLCGPCRVHFDAVQAGLQALGIEFVLESRLVRGLDYYVRTAFEVISEGLHAAQDAVAGGGRYDGLVESLGGPPTGAVGFAIGVERSLEATRWANILSIRQPRSGSKAESAASSGLLTPGYSEQKGPPRFRIRDSSPDVVVVGVDDSCRTAALALGSRLRREGIATVVSPVGKSLKARMKYADRAGAHITAVIGPEELASQTVAIRLMGSTEAKIAKQRTVPSNRAVSEVLAILRSESSEGDGTVSTSAQREPK